MRYALSISLTVLLFASAVLAAQPHVVTLKGKAVVSGEKVHLRDIASIDGTDAERLGSIFIMNSPVGPIGTELSADYVASRISTSFHGGFVMKGAQRIRIVQKYTVISKKRLKRIFENTVLAKSPWRGKGKIMIEDIQIAGSAQVLERDRDAIQAKISPREDFLGRTSITLVFGEGASAQQIRLSAKVKVVANIPVVKTSLRRGDIITEDNLEVKPLEVSAYPKAVMDKKDCLGKRAKTSLRRGRPFLRTNIEEPPLISRGDIVFIQARSDSLVIRDKGVALKDGCLADQIPVRNATSGKQIVGTIIAASCIEVYF
jgi:flagella basal body P-ring formation protein FlgA